MALRRFQYVTVIRVYATPPTFEASVEGKVAHWAALVDRRIELAVRPSSRGPRSGTIPAGPYLKILGCKQRSCIWRARGRGTMLYSSSFRSMPRSWKFTPPQAFLVDFQFDCGPVTGRSYSFLRYEVDDAGDRVTLREYADQRNIDTVAAGAKRLAL